MDSRTAEDGRSIRRRRECFACKRRFTTFEKIEDSSFVVIKRSGHRELFERFKVVAGLKSALKNRPVSDEQIDAVAFDIEDALRSEGSEVSTERVGIVVLEHLRNLDEVGYLRFASVYKGFAEAKDFEREFSFLSKSTEPKKPRL